MVFYNPLLLSQQIFKASVHPDKAWWVKNKNIFNNLIQKNDIYLHKTLAT